MGKAMGLNQVHAAVHVLVVAVSLTLSFAQFDNSLFAWHPIFMSLGYILFMTEGVLSALSFRSLEGGAERVQAIQGHALLQLRAVVCICLGFGVIFRNKMLHGKPHFTSLHGRLGLATFVLGLLAPLGGAVSFRRLGLIHSFPEPWQPRIKWLHRQMGIVTLLLAFLTIEVILPKKSVAKGLLTPFWQGGVAVIGALVLLLWARSPGLAKATDALAKAV